MSLVDDDARARLLIEGAESALEQAIAKGDAALTHLNASSMVRFGLMHGLMKWRTGADPREMLMRGVKAIRRAREWLLGRGNPFGLADAIPWEALWFSEDLLGEPRTAGAPPKMPKVAKIVHLDRAMLAALAGHEGALDAEVERLARGKRKGLVLRTYATYAAILKSADGSALLSAISEAEDNFVQRGGSREYEGLVTSEGGGAYNVKVVDYRLAAALKRVEYRGPSLHAWRWS